MTATGTIERTPLLAAVETRLESLPFTIYLGEAGTVDKVEGDRLGRVAPYGVLTPFLGNPSEEQNLAETTVDLAWGFQLTVASGFVRDTLGAAELADELLYRWTPEPDADLGYVVGMLMPPPGYTASLLPDKDETPHRFFIPLQYGTTITRS